MVDYTDLDQGRPVGRPAAADTRRRKGTIAGLRRFLGSINIWFWAIVGVPTLIAGVYYFAIAANLYMTEAEFLVRSPKQTSANSFGAMLQSTGLTRAEDDTAAVNDYMMSRDAVQKLEQHDDLRAMLSRPEGDFVTRFPGLVFWRHDFEALFKRYGHFVSVETDTSTGISTLQVKAYRAADAQKIAAALLGYAEKLVNDMNDRARRDALATFQHEVQADKDRLAKIQIELTAYRVKQKMLDPKSAAAGPLELMAQLGSAAANARAQLSDMLANSRHNPQIPLIRTRIASLDKQIADERSKLSGNVDSVATAATEYERLDLDRQLAEKTLASAFASLEAARLEAQRQQLYLETITQPNLADYPLYPKRAESFLMVFATCLLAYGIAWLLIASVREHTA